MRFLTLGAKLCKKYWHVMLVSFLFLRFFCPFSYEETYEHKQKYSNILETYGQPNWSGTTESRIFTKFKKRPFSILFWTKKWHSVEPAEFFKSLKGCGNEFEITSNRAFLDRADAIVFSYYELNADMRDGTLKMPSRRNPNVPWILATKESPIRTKPFKTHIYDGAFNFTWGYRSDADIHPVFVDMYEKFETLDENWIYGSDFSKEFLRNKTELAAWVVSNCRSESSKRQLFVSKLEKLGIIVHTYGKCGRPCDGKWRHGNWKDDACFINLGKQYKFYMSLENSLCLDYITEKPEHGWSHNMIPIIYALGNKELVTPPGSYIDATEFEKNEDLAEYIKFLDKNAREYFKYFSWRSVYNISSSFHYQENCYAFQKIRELTENSHYADDSVRNKNVDRNLELWRSYFYNNQSKMYCRNCLKRSQVNLTHPKQNKVTIYSNNNSCLKNGPMQNLSVDWDSWY